MSNDDRTESHRETKGHARAEPEGLHKEAQNPDEQPSSRGGGGLAPSDAPVLLLHRRGRADSNMLQDFESEKLAREYAKEHGLMIVYSETVGKQQKLYYLPE